MRRSGSWMQKPARSKGIPSRDNALTSCGLLQQIFTFLYLCWHLPVHQLRLNKRGVFRLPRGVGYEADKIIYYIFSTYICTFDRLRTRAGVCIERLGEDGRA